jgi:hypothetical protein
MKSTVFSLILMATHITPAWANEPYLMLDYGTMGCEGLGPSVAAYKNTACISLVVKQITNNADGDQDASKTIILKEYLLPAKSLTTETNLNKVANEMSALSDKVYKLELIFKKLKLKKDDPRVKKFIQNDDLKDTVNKALASFTDKTPGLCEAFDDKAIRDLGSDDQAIAKQMRADFSCKISNTGRAGSGNDGTVISPKAQ